MPILSDVDRTRLRDFYIRDHFEAPSQDDPSGTALSTYNMAMQRNFASDDYLEDLATRIELDKSEVLDNVAADKSLARLGAGDTQEAADEKGAALRQDALFRLIRAGVWQAMMNDAGFKASLADVKEMAVLFATWRQQIERDTQFLARRSGGFGSLEVARK